MTDASRRIVIIGLDGMPYGLIKDLAENGVMPHTRALIERGVFRQMLSSIPEISSVAWSSIVTGMNPGHHGIFGFTDIPTGTYRLSFPTYRDVKVPPFWKRDRNGKSVVINVPFTYPADSLDGVLIAGFVALDLGRATYPPSLVPKLSDMGYRIDVDSDKAHKSLDLFLRDLDRTLTSRIDVYRYLWDDQEWQTFMLVFTGTDRLAHFLWNAYEEKTHKYHSAFLDHLNRIDGVVGEIVNKMDDGDSLVMLSDHGFERAEVDLCVNYFLKQEGFLRFRKEPPQSMADMDYGTRAFALDPARIYVNLEGKYPRGSVKLEEREAVIEDLVKAFEALEAGGKTAASRICRKEEIYEGPCIEQAPDLVILPNKGINFRGNPRAQKLIQESPFTGKHTQQDAFLLLSNTGECILPSNLCVSDVLDIVDKLSE
jgi:predicted AlkP superfamily phosphohydrolase/phosphomutase